MKEIKDIAVIGGGAAGLCFSILVKNVMPCVGVTVFEANDRVGRKIAVTGNGRCNISNRILTVDKFHGERDLAEKLLQSFGFIEQQRFFEELGVYFKLEGDKAYPASLQATSVVDALRFSAEEKGVEIVCGCPVSSVKRENGEFVVETKRVREVYRSVVVACGGKAGGKLGNTSGYEILKHLGHKIEPIFPSIVQLKTETDVVRQLKGIKVDATVTLSSSLGERTEFGEVLFCDYGLSGPPVLQVSRMANGENPTVKLDLIPDFTRESLAAALKKTIKLHPSRPTSELFTGLLHKKIGQVATKLCGVDLNGMLANLSDSEMLKIVDKIKCFKLKVLGTTGFENAQVTAGGAQVAQFFDNLMSKKAKGLFAIGEVLNVDGDCGGFNLAFAWSSAFAAANGVADFFNGDNK